MTRDALTASFCYDLLLENAELRKMCNACARQELERRAHGRRTHTTRSTGAECLFSGAESDPAAASLSLG